MENQNSHFSKKKIEFFTFPKGKLINSLSFQNRKLIFFQKGKLVFNFSKREIRFLTFLEED